MHDDFLLSSCRRIQGRRVFYRKVPSPEGTGSPSQVEPIGIERYSVQKMLTAQHKYPERARSCGGVLRGNLKKEWMIRPGTTGLSLARTTTCAPLCILYTKLESPRLIAKLLLGRHAGAADWRRQLHLAAAGDTRTASAWALLDSWKIEPTMPIYERLEAQRASPLRTFSALCGAGISCRYYKDR